MKTYDDIFDELWAEDLIVSYVTYKDKTIWLEIYTPGIQAEMRMEIARKVCGDSCDITHLPNHDKIRVEFKN